MEDHDLDLLLSENFALEDSFEESYQSSSQTLWTSDASAQSEDPQNLPMQPSPSHSPKSRRVGKRLTQESVRTKKTEELDKFWLRAFREFIKKNYLQYTFTPDDSQFWDEYRNEQNLPGKGREFRSYGKGYKTWLFGHMCFAQAFADWFEFKGIEKLAEKRTKNTPIFDEYYNYAKLELLTWHERQMNNQISPCMSPQFSPSVPEPMQIEEIYLEQDFGEEMVLEYEMTPEEFLDAALGQTIY